MSEKLVPLNELKRLALTGPWYAGVSVNPDPLFAVARLTGKPESKDFDGRNAMARAVAYAERMNRKENGK